MSLSPIESINTDVFGQFLVGLNHVTGTQGLINPKDIPYIYKYARNLACTSRKMNSYFKEELPTQVFLDSMTARFDQPFKDFAFEFNTRGSLKCVWSYIKSKGLDRDYAEIYKIYSIAQDILVDVEILKPNIDYNSTSSGIQLVAKNFSLSLATPFGDISFRYRPFRRNNFLKKIEEVYGKTFIVETLSPLNLSKYDPYAPRIWRMLQKNKLGKDPIKPIERFPEIFRRRTDKKITEVVPWIVKHLEKLINLPRTTSGNRFLTVDMSFNQMKIIELLNDSAKKKMIWGQRWILSLKEKRIYLGDNEYACPLVELAKTYEGILQNLTGDLIPVKLRDFPDIQPLQSEEEFQLFDGKKTSNELLKCLIRELGMYDDVIESESVNGSNFYWVRKKKSIEDTGLFKPGSLVQKEVS